MSLSRGPRPNRPRGSGSACGGGSDLEDLCDSTVDDDNDGIAARRSKLLRRHLIEVRERGVDEATIGEASGERHLAGIAERLPVGTRHQHVRQRSSVGVIDVDDDDHDLVHRLAEGSHPGDEVDHPLDVEQQGVAAVVLLDRDDHAERVGIIENERAAFFTNCCSWFVMRIQWSLSSVTTVSSDRVATQHMSKDPV